MNKIYLCMCLLMCSSTNVFCNADSGLHSEADTTKLRLIANSVWENTDYANVFNLIFSAIFAVDADTTVFYNSVNKLRSIVDSTNNICVSKAVISAIEIIVNKTDDATVLMNAIQTLRCIHTDNVDALRSIVNLFFTVTNKVTKEHSTTHACILIGLRDVVSKTDDAIVLSLSAKVFHYIVHNKRLKLEDLLDSAYTLRLITENAVDIDTLNVVFSIIQSATKATNDGCLLGEFADILKCIPDKTTDIGILRHTAGLLYDIIRKAPYAAISKKNIIEALVAIASKTDNADIRNDIIKMLNIVKEVNCDNNTKLLANEAIDHISGLL